MILSCRSGRLYGVRRFCDGNPPIGLALMTSALLLSGGMDSIAIAYWKQPKYGLTVDYGQIPASAEIRASAAVCTALNIRHEVIHADISALGSGDLSGRRPASVAPARDWWPYRNQFLLTVVGMKCHLLGATEVMIGTLRTDDLHADGTKGFVQSMNALFELQEGALRIIAPAIDLSAAELVRSSGIPFHLLAWSHSCHVAETACGFCRGCRKHYETMMECFDRAY